MTYVIVHALAPIFVIMLLGFWAGKAKMVDNKNVSLLNIFVMDFALPAALFSATVQTPWTGIVAQSPLILVLTLAASTAGAILASTLTGRLLGISIPMSMALGMNVMVGFPMNMLISQEIIEGLTEDAAERQRLMNEIAAKMVLGGMVTTTFLATLAAGLLAPLMH